MIILSTPMSIAEIAKLNDFPNHFVKGVVDIAQGIVALDADMHYQLLDYLKEQKGSEETDMWGFNLWLDETGEENILEYDSFINIHNNQMHGFLRGGLNILDPDTEAKATEVIRRWILF